MNQCPWTQFEPDPYPFCEEALCSWIREPANTWTNIAYFIVGFLLWRKYQDSKNIKANPVYLLFSIAAIYLGIGSGLFHASVVMWTKKIDVSAMHVIASTGLMLTLNRRRPMDYKKMLLGIAVLTSLCFPFIGWGKAGSIVFLSMLATVIGHEIWLSYKIPLKWDQKKYLMGLIVAFVLSFIASEMDRDGGLLCNPDNHIFTGHGFWHFGTALCIYLGALYFAKFTKSGSEIGNKA